MRLQPAPACVGSEVDRLSDAASNMVFCKREVIKEPLQWGCTVDKQLR